MVIKRIFASLGVLLFVVILAIAIASGAISARTNSVSMEKHIFFKLGEKYNAEDDFRKAVKDPNNYKIYIESAERYADNAEDAGAYLDGTEIMAKYVGRYRVNVHLKYRGSSNGKDSVYITYYMTVLDNSYSDYRHIRSMYDFAGYDSSDKFILMNDIVVDGGECLSEYIFFQGVSFSGTIVNPYGYNILLKNSEKQSSLFGKFTNAAVLYQLKISGINFSGENVFGVSAESLGAIIDCNFTGKLTASSEAVAVALSGSIINCKFYGEISAPKIIKFPKQSVNCEFIALNGGKANA